MISAAIERCAGIDVGKRFLAVCILTGPLEGEPRVERRRFGTWPVSAARTNCPGIVTALALARAIRCA